MGMLTTNHDVEINAWRRSAQQPFRIFGADSSMNTRTEKGAEDLQKSLEIPMVIVEPFAMLDSSGTWRFGVSSEAHCQAFCISTAVEALQRGLAWSVDTSKYGISLALFFCCWSANLTMSIIQERDGLGVSERFSCCF